MQFNILDANWSKFEKKMNIITKRYARMRKTFSYEILGHAVKDVEVEGRKVKMPVTVVEVNDPEDDGRYQFAASIDHFNDGNVIRGFGAFEIPFSYTTSKPMCDHCGTDRYRKSTYLVYDGVEDKFLQLGKSCLCEVVGNISAEGIALYESLVHFCDDCEHYTGPAAKTYIDTNIFMQCVVSVVDHFGFSPTSFGANSTRTRSLNYYNATLGLCLNAKEIRQEMKEYGIEIEDAANTAKDVIEWCRNLDVKNEYLNNLHVILMNDYFDYRYLGIVASAYTAYLRQGEYEKKIKEKEPVDEGEWIGEEGERINIVVSDWKCVTSNDGYYGLSFLYQFTTPERQTVNWWTSKYIDDDKEIQSLRGTVKKLDIYKGRKITTVTRCRLG